MANDIPELKPCPFCEGSAEIQEGIIYGHYVECSSCDLTLGVSYGSDGEWNGDFDGVGDAFRAWNTRTAPKVKPLEWEKPLGCAGFVSKPVFDQAYYWIYQGSDFRWKFALGGVESGVCLDTLDEARNAAQADYTRRILSAIE